VTTPTGIASLGEDWIGQTPRHWSVRKLGFVFDLISSGTTPPTENRDFYDGDVPWITTSELRENLIVDANVKLTRAAMEAHSALRIYDVGTILIAMYGATIGRLGILGIEAATNQACCALARPRGAHPKFVYYALLAGRVVLIEQASGGGQPNINQEKIHAFKIPVPPVPRAGPENLDGGISGVSA
jgi:type I restriction enzyme S subunit